MPKETEVFSRFLAEKDLKMTPQRREVLDVFLKINKHLSAEELYDIIKKKNPDIGQATVFRSLKLLCEAGIARKVDLGDKKIRYEHNYGHQHHDHLICIECGSFIEVFDSVIENMQEKLCNKFNFLPQSHRMEIFGVCDKCNG